MKDDWSYREAIARPTAEMSAIDEDLPLRRSSPDFERGYNEGWSDAVADERERSNTAIALDWFGGIAAGIVIGLCIWIIAVKVVG